MVEKLITGLKCPLGGWLHLLCVVGLLRPVLQRHALFRLLHGPRFDKAMSKLRMYKSIRAGHEALIIINIAVRPQSRPWSTLYEGVILLSDNILKIDHPQPIQS